MISMTECPDCGTPVSAAAATCPHCGADLGDELHTCAHCGQEFSAREAACPACGHLVLPERCARHPDRTAAGRCVVCGTPVCSECDSTSARHYLCPDHRDVAVIEGWAEVYSAGNELEAQLIRDNLHAEGIDAEVLSQKDHFTITVDLGDLNQVRVLVPAFQYENALDIIDEHTDDTGRLTFACPSCGEAYEPGDTVCASCGAALPPSSD